MTTADVVARTFFEGWVASGYGIPNVLLTDNGSQFLAKFFQNFCKILGIKQVFTSAYRPSTNGQTERFNRTVRYDWLTQTLFGSIEEVQDAATRWLWTYNNERPNMGLGGITPMQKLAKAA